MIMDAFELLARWGRPPTPIIRPRQTTGSPDLRDGAGHRPDLHEADASNSDELAQLILDP